MMGSKIQSSFPDPFFSKFSSYTTNLLNIIKNKAKHVFI